MSSHPLTEEYATQHPTRRVQSLLMLIGNTPLVRLKHITRDLPETVEVWVKLEFMNPGGSIKDRAARQIIIDAMQQKKLGRGQTLIDATSGNTGVAYAMIGASLGFDVELVIPASVSPIRRQLIEAYGAKIVYSPEEDGSDGAIRLVKEIVENAEEDTYFYADQYGNPSNPRAHEITTSEEIWEQTEGRVSHFIAATGTSGTLMGTTRGLKSRNPEIKVMGCQPSDSSHGLEGLKHMASSIVPPIYNADLLDDTVFVETNAALEMAARLASEEGIAAGNSAGANVYAAMKLARTLEHGVIVTVICDHADRYLAE